jgi:hypothetical protein
MQIAAVTTQLDRVSDRARLFRNASFGESENRAHSAAC